MSQKLTKSNNNLYNKMLQNYYNKYYIIKTSNIPMCKTV